MIKIKLATPIFFFLVGGGGIGVRLSCKRVVRKYSIAYVPFCSVLHYLTHGCHERADR